MIVDIFLYVLALPLIGLVKILAQLGYILPENFQSSVVYFLSYLRYMDWIVPVDTLLDAIGTLLIFFVVWYTAVLAVRIIGGVPLLGKTVNFIHTKAK